MRYGSRGGRLRISAEITHDVLAAQPRHRLVEQHQLGGLSASVVSESPAHACDRTEQFTGRKMQARRSRSTFRPASRSTLRIQNVKGLLVCCQKRIRRGPSAVAARCAHSRAPTNAGNTADIWKERADTQCELSYRFAAFGDVQFRRRRCWPGRRHQDIFVSRLKTGRLSGAVRADQRMDGAALRTARFTFLTAMKPPKDFERPSARKIGSALAVALSVALKPSPPTA